MVIELPHELGTGTALEKLNLLLHGNWVLQPAQSIEDIERDLCTITRSDEHSTYVFEGDGYNMTVHEVEDALHRLYAVGAVGDEKTNIQDFEVRVASDDLMPAPGPKSMRVEHARRQMWCASVIAFMMGLLVMAILAAIF